MKNLCVLLAIMLLLTVSCCTNNTGYRQFQKGQIVYLRPDSTESMYLGKQGLQIPSNEYCRVQYSDSIGQLHHITISSNFIY